MERANGPPTRDDPVFCQREAAETAVFLADVAGRHATADYRRRLEPVHAEHDDGLPRVGLKMATGTGKTVVMAMLIAWQTINKVMTPSDARFAKAVLGRHPRDHDPRPARRAPPQARGLLLPRARPAAAGLWEALPHAQVQIVNYHAFLPRDAKEIQGVAANTRKLLRGGKLEDADAFRETPELVAARILRGFGAGRGEIVVLNDEAHHCYQDRLSEHPDPRPTRTTGIETARRGSGFAASSTSSASPGSRRFTTSRPRRTSSRGPATTRVSSFPG